MTEVSQSPSAVAGGYERVKAGDRTYLFRDPAKSKFWQVEYCDAGRQIRRSTKKTSLKEARKEAARIEARLTLGQNPQSECKPTSVNDAIEKYIASRRDRGRSERTLVLYQRDLGQFAAFAGTRGIYRLDQCDTDLLEAFQRQLVSGGYRGPGKRKKHAGPVKPCRKRTVRGKLKTVRQLIKFAIKRRIITGDPAPGYELPPTVKQETFCWPPDQVEQLLKLATTPAVDIFNFLRMSGLRSEEFCYLLKSDFDQEHSEVQVRAKTCPQSGRHWRPKHGNERVVPLCPAAFELAKKAFDASPGPWLFHAPDTRGSQPGRWRVHRIWRMLKDVMKQAGIENGTVHTFRHVFCSYLANHCAGVTPFQVMKLMGHSSMDIVLTYYHVRRDDLRSAVSQIDFKQPLKSAKEATNSKSAEN
jgi:site-specific recombinase XerD